LQRARVNKYGQKLVELCKRCSLYIANGRVYKDKFIGRSTSYYVKNIKKNVFDCVHLKTWG
jgi:hypothetical protein